MENILIVNHINQFSKNGKSFVGNFPIFISEKNCNINNTESSLNKNYFIIEKCNCEALGYSSLPIICDPPNEPISYECIDGKILTCYKPCDPPLNPNCTITSVTAVPPGNHLVLSYSEIYTLWNGPTFLKVETESSFTTMLSEHSSINETKDIWDTYPSGAMPCTYITPLYKNSSSIDNIPTYLESNAGFSIGLFMDFFNIKKFNNTYYLPVEVYLNVGATYYYDYIDIDGEWYYGLYISCGADYRLGEFVPPDEYTDHYYLNSAGDLAPDQTTITILGQEFPISCKGGNAGSPYDFYAGTFDLRPITVTLVE